MIQRKQFNHGIIKIYHVFNIMHVFYQVVIFTYHSIGILYKLYTCIIYKAIKYWQLSSYSQYHWYEKEMDIILSSTNSYSLIVQFFHNQLHFLLNPRHHNCSYFLLTYYFQRYIFYSSFTNIIITTTITSMYIKLTKTTSTESSLNYITSSFNLV